ncbi:hypothetical protein VM57_02785 [Stenotrophomonas maltophilia]|uniref:HTH lysR-type domain-containing protein n=1 Tax=Stenotrophomonas maltophilia TaxID=40324 RepID=A0A0F5ZRN2_STEMA|nr:hypothetical protein VM57_02785 [Stenotrophomonas maltophilia]
MLPTERLRGIEAFVATADAGSFTAAAERLHLTAMVALISGLQFLLAFVGLTLPTSHARC